MRRLASPLLITIYIILWRASSNILASETIYTVFLPTILKAPIYYISPNGDNSSGDSWETAWNELDQIDWNVISPSSIIYIDGGTEQMVYQTGLLLW